MVAPVTGGDGAKAFKYTIGGMQVIPTFEEQCGNSY
jgi:hypothetical protein